MPTGFENAGRGREQGRRVRRGGNFGRRTVMSPHNDYTQREPVTACCASHFYGF